MGTFDAFTRQGGMRLGWPRQGRTFFIAALAIAALLFIVIATFPLGLLKGVAERRLASRLGSEVRVASMERESFFSFSPVLRLSGIDVNQPAWAGAGKLATVTLLRVRVHMLPLLAGRTRAEVLNASGVRLNLVRNEDGVANWRGTGKKKDADGGDGAATAVATVEDAIISYRDAVQKRAFTIALTITPARGLEASGSGEVDGAPVKLTLSGAPMMAGKSWPFDALIDGPALRIHAVGAMEGPMRTDAMRFRMEARADDLKRLDRVIEAGLFGTQPIDLKADVRHEDRTWTIGELSGGIGESKLSGSLKAHKRDGRTMLDADVRFSRLNFDDLASDQGQAEALAMEAQLGLRLVPNTTINIRKISKTDGQIKVKVDSVVGGRRPSSITSLDGVLTLENRLLTVEPLRLGLKRGAITGKVVVDQRDGQEKPTVTLTMDMTNSSIVALAGGGSDDVNGRVDGRIRLTGVGSTIREVVGQSDGSIGIVARNGSLPAKLAALMGFDIGKGLLGDDEERATLRCAVMLLDMRKGRGTANPLIIDTSISQSRGAGTLSFPSEALAMTLTGAPKGSKALRLPGSVQLHGRLREPEIVVPKETKSVGNVLKAISRAVKGTSGPAATDADCAALSRKAIGRS
jgi:uncharacterized protein involved in outer membrane biogenesis